MIPSTEHFMVIYSVEDLACLATLIYKCYTVLYVAQYNVLHDKVYRTMKVQGNDNCAGGVP